MLAFIVPVKHPARSRDYTVVTDLLRRTLASLENQKDPHFVTVIVLNQKPEWAVDTPNRIFVEVDFPPADPPKDRADWVNWIYLDKGAKNAVGLLHAARFNPTHAMFVDADDFVSNRLAGFVREHPSANGWYMTDGLFYSGLFKIATSRDRFWSYCGTSHIIRYDLLPVPPSLGLQPKKDAIVAALDSFYLIQILGFHVHFQKYYRDRGHPLQALPFEGAVYHADTGENASRAWWNGSRFGPVWGVPLTADQLAEYGIPPGTRTPAQSMVLSAWRARSMAARTVKTLLGRSTQES
jgi:hypothetical protein